MTLDQVELFIELLAGTGWLDGVSENIRYMLDDGIPVPEIRAKCQLIDSIIREYNTIVNDDYDIGTERELDRVLVLNK